MTAVVTGAATGLGRAIALDFARRGVNIAFNYIELPGRDIGAQALMTETTLRACGVSVYSEHCDIRSRDKVEGFVERAQAELGGIHHLVNNAGLARDASLWRMERDAWDSVLETNVTGTFNCIRAVARHFREQRYGKIVNVASHQAYRPGFGVVNFATSKSALLGLTRSVAVELGPYNVNVNAVAPGFVRTEMIESMPPEVLEDAEKVSVLGRIAEPEDVANVVTFLCSDDARHITGQVILVDGGFTLHCSRCMRHRPQHHSHGPSEEGVSTDLVQMTHEEGVATLRLNHPPLNLMTIEMVEHINSVLLDLRGKRDLKVLVIRGSKRAFSAGIDLREHTRDKVGRLIQVFHRIFESVRLLDVIAVSAVEGVALGPGFELAIGSNLVVASESARFGVPEVKLGLFPPVASVILPRATPRRKAMEWILTGDEIPAQELMQYGLVNRVYPDDEFESGLDAFVAQLTSKSGPVLQLAKRAQTESYYSGWEEALYKAENLYLRDLMALADSQEGLDAFLEKREPKWQDS